MTLNTRKIPYLFLLAIVALFYTYGARAADNFNVSTKPLHSLTASIMEGVSVPTLILRNTKSLHHVSLLPSTIRKLQSADFIVWMGPNIEPYLEKALNAVPTTKKTYDLGEFASNDIHWWSDPALAIALIAPLSQFIIEHDPENKTAYQANATALTAQLEKLISEVSSEFLPFSEIRFLTVHEVYNRFNARFGLPGGESIEHNGVIGAKTIARLRKELLQSNVQCVFGEAGENSAILTTLLEGTTAKSAILDGLGSELAAGPSFYEKLIRQIANTYVTCFNAQPQL